MWHNYIHLKTRLHGCTRNHASRNGGLARYRYSGGDSDDVPPTIADHAVHSWCQSAQTGTAPDARSEKFCVTDSDGKSGDGKHADQVEQQHKS